MYLDQILPKSGWRTCFVLILTLFSTSMAQVQLTGFFDLQQRFRLDDQKNEGMHYGQMEMDFSNQVANLLYAEAAFAYDTEQDKLVIGAGYVNFTIIDDNAETPVRGNFLGNHGIIVGQFDVPFGVDYRYIPSPDRYFVLPPLANEKTINSLNRFGAVIYGHASAFNFALFGVNSDEHEGAAVGIRVGFHALPRVEAGLSAMADMRGLQLVTARVFGADITAEVGDFEFRGELIQSDGMIEGQLDPMGTGETSSGFYAQGLYHIQGILENSAFVMFRYGRWEGARDWDTSGVKDEASRISAGLGYHYDEQVEIRLVYRADEWETVTTSYATAQIVVSF